VAALFSTSILSADESQEDPFRELREEENAQRLKMVEQSANVLRKNDSRLAMSWPENTAVYSATVQSWPAWPDIHTDRPYFFQEIDKSFQRGDARTLDQAARMLKDGWCWPYVPFTPQVPAFTAAEDVHGGWNKRDQGKNRYMLLISGEGSRSSSDDYEDSFYEPLRGKLAEWIQDRPQALHTLDQRFVDHLNAQGDEDSAYQYIHSLTEEKRFLDGAHYLKDVLQKQFGVPDNNDHVLVMPYPRLQNIHDAFKGWVAARQECGSELVVIYNGHGILKKDVEDSAPQGLAEGILCINNDEKLHETTFKQLVTEYAAKFDAVSIVLDACHSGAFVA
jgi:hypothetical protein